MHIHVFDKATGKEVSGRYTLDTSLGVPAVGDEIRLRTHSHKDFYAAATVRGRTWIFTDSEPERAYLHLWIQYNGS